MEEVKEESEEEEEEGKRRKPQRRHTIAGVVVTRKLGKVGLFEAVVVAVHRAHLERKMMRLGSFFPSAFLSLASLSLSLSLASLSHENEDRSAFECVALLVYHHNHHIIIIIIIVITNTPGQAKSP
jgi:hypothetical protein